MKKIFFIIALSVLFSNSFFAQTKTEPQNIFGKKYDYVNDFEKILTPKQVQTLSATLKSCETKTGHKIVIVTTPSISPYTDLSDYSLELDKYLNTSLKIDASIILVISKQLRQIQIRGLDKLRNKLSDKEVESIISTFVIPELKKGDYYKGLQDGAAQIIKKLE
ncbi:MAG: TPM domain-containing protein [Flavobacterium circumlabens]|uniref:TLP18.3/Psb32/MOLO-1 phosphatase superfamily protein n=1 Tax=Flavobacterium circumlabens TaxID=2133765 RepID=A0A4Y7UEE9_9FLAO|nr:TPM domain-containing protein [Flavobacterium circumlabens]TCN58794.1 TLP18.3/Psb32/MOLO-1 phosphatase superfamily protein [Flavobacterium circumlabens]TEB44209.1 TPM domain-containing protein [Flavobacterium circumlabens]